MQAYEVEFTPAQLPPFRITDGIRAQRVPHLHVSVGDPATPGKGVRVPLTTRLAASCNGAEALIARAAAYRDPKSGSIVLGMEQVPASDDARALVLLVASSSFPEGVSVTPRKEVGLLAKGETRKRTSSCSSSGLTAGRSSWKIPRAKSGTSCGAPAMSSNGWCWDPPVDRQPRPVAGARIGASTEVARCRMCVCLPRAGKPPRRRGGDRTP